MVTKEQALTAKEFHINGCYEFIGPRGGVIRTVELWRRSGEAKLRKLIPYGFRVPIMHGLRDHDYITEFTACCYHLPKDCPLDRDGGAANREDTDG